MLEEVFSRCKAAARCSKPRFFFQRLQLSRFGCRWDSSFRARKSAFGETAFF
ncbi:hypothetical protein PO124_22210 [Bacillus licheniformis]|nr:hypothetical protein [Bacillus licheniformis]